METQQKVPGKLAIYMQKTETRLLSLTLYKNQLDMGQRTESKTSDFEITTENHRENFGRNR
jgi:hypothetical protein